MDAQLVALFGANGFSPGLHFLDAVAAKAGHAPDPEWTARVMRLLSDVLNFLNRIKRLVAWTI